MNAAKTITHLMTQNTNKTNAGNFTAEHPTLIAIWECI